MKLNIKKGGFLSSIIILASGSIIAQIITLICLPFITRIYSPDDIGLYSYVISVAAIFMGIINARYDICIVTDQDETHTFPLIKLSFIVGIIITLFASLIFGFIFYFKGMSKICIIYFSLSLLSYSLINICTAYNNRIKNYKLISSVYVVRTFCQNIGALVWGIINKSMHGQLGSYVIGQYLGFFQDSKSLRPHIKEISKISLKKVKEVSLIHKKQFIFSTPAQLFNSFSYSLITIVLEALYTFADVGFYSISMRGLGLPLAIISTNVSKVFMQRASEEYSKTGQFYQSFKRTSLFLFSISLPMVLFLVFFSKGLCSFLLGKEWIVAGEYIVILSPMFGVRFITTALVPSFVIIRKQGKELLLQSLFFLSPLISLLFQQIYNWGIENFLICLSILLTISYLIFFMVIGYYSKRINKIK